MLIEKFVGYMEENRCRIQARLCPPDQSQHSQKNSPAAYQPASCRIRTGDITARTPRRIGGGAEAHRRAKQPVPLIIDQHRARSHPGCRITFLSFQRLLNPLRTSSARSRKDRLSRRIGSAPASLRRTGREKRSSCCHLPNRVSAAVRRRGKNDSRPL